MTFFMFKSLDCAIEVNNSVNIAKVKLMFTQAGGGKKP